MTCESSRELLTAFIDGELDKSRASTFEEHVEGCDVCLRELAAQQAVRVRLGDRLLRFDPPAGLAARIQESLAAPRSREARVGRLTWVAAACAILGLGVGLFGLVVASTRQDSAELLARDV